VFVLIVFSTATYNILNNKDLLIYYTMANYGLGFGSVILSVLFYGSNFVPVKQYPTGDGMFFQVCLHMARSQKFHIYVYICEMFIFNFSKWIMAIGIWTTALIVNIIQPAKFEPFAMLGNEISGRFYWNLQYNLAPSTPFWRSCTHPKKV
jgi:hypothetical protein